MTTDIDRGGLDVGASHEPSYYEIALTNRQVVVAFVILLTCVVAAFLSGVWLGRESAARAQEKLALLTHGSAAGAATASAAGGGSGSDASKPDQALQEFKFFADSRHRSAEAAGSPVATGPASPQAPPAEDSATAADSGDAAAGGAAGAAPAGKGKGRGAPGAAAFPPPGQAAAAPPAAPAAASSSSSSAASVTSAGRPGRQNGAPGTAAPTTKAARPANAAAAPAATQPAQATSGGGQSAAAPPTADVVHPKALPDRNTAPAGTSASAAAAAAAGGAGEVVIQVFSSADKEQADRVKDALVQNDFSAFLSPITKDGQTMYRVRIGPFPNRAAAEPVAEKVRKEQKLDTWITPK